MQVTKQNIEAVRKLAYARLEVRNAEIDAGTSEFLTRAATAVVETEAGELRLTLDEVRAKRTKTIRDTYRLNGKIVAKSKLPQI